MPGTRQLELFPGGGNRDEGRVEPVEPLPEYLALAARIPKGLRLGTSSWSFPGWTGIVYRYPADESALARVGLEAYARHPLLRAAGIDRTFYAPLPAADFERYARAVPEGFRFLVKAAQDCTFPALPSGGARGTAGRNPRFLEPSFAREEVVGPALEGLGAKLGTLLFQFPPLGRSVTGEPSAFADRLGRFLSVLPRGPLYSVEIRNRELLGRAYAAALASTGAAHAFTIHPAMPSLAEQAALLGVESQPALVVRWMLGHGRGYEEARDLYAHFDHLVAPDPASRRSIASLARAALRGGKEVLVVVNNKAEGSSPLSVVELARELAATGG